MEGHDVRHVHLAQLVVETCTTCGAVTGLRDENSGNSVSNITAHMDWHMKMGGVLIDIFTSRKMPFWRGRAMRRIARG